jgi:SAM-dependent methyltransferase
MRELTRREALEFLIAGGLAVFSAGFVELGFAQDNGNFRHVYLNPKLREQFFLFLKNVFHLYPEQDFHHLIELKVMKYGTDQEIYQAILAEIPSLKPILSTIRYALPALKKQKQVMCEQTVALLDGKKRIDGYLEVGSTGRYLDRLQDSIEVKGPIYVVNTTAPTFGAADIVERGHLQKAGDYVPLSDYNEISASRVPDESLDLLTVYIGFHHAPTKKRDPFIQSCHRALRKGGSLIVRDHDVNSADMAHFVALAHDVFNCGLELPWQSNEAEVRNFTSIAQLDEILKREGFIPDDRRLLQDGDPTYNTLMKYTKA